MKKEDAVSLIVYVLMIIIAVLVGWLVIAQLFSSLGTYLPGKGNANMAFAFLFVFVAVIFNVFYLEIGHIVGAKAGGYTVISFNVIGLCLYRAEKGWKFKFSNFDGLTGETKIAPKKEKTSAKTFALMPLIFYVIEVALFMTIFYLIRSKLNDVAEVSRGYTHLSWLVILSLMIVVVGGMIELYNIFPAKLDSLTDGYRLVVLSKKENIEAYNELMRIECAYYQKRELTDMKVFNQITDFTCQVNLYSVYKYFGQKNYTEAENLLDLMIASKDKLSRENYCSCLAQKMYLVLLNKPYEEAKKYYDEHITQVERRFISNDLSMQSIRAYLLISSILDISEHEARYAIGRVNKALKRTLPGRVDIEKELYALALNKVDQVRPEWHIKQQEVK